MRNHWHAIWQQFKKSKIGFAALFFFLLIFAIGLYAPLFASSKPILVWWKGKLYFPLFRYLFYRGFFSKPIDLFYNLLMFTFPLFLLFWRRKTLCAFLCIAHLSLFLFLLQGWVKDPQSTSALRHMQHEKITAKKNHREDPILAPFTPYPTWNAELKTLPPYAQLTQLLKAKQRKDQHTRLTPYRSRYLQATGEEMATLWHVAHKRDQEKRAQLLKTTTKNKEAYERALEQLPELIAAYRPHSHDFLIAKYELEQAKQRVDVLSDHSHTDEYRSAVGALAQLENHLQETIQQSAESRTPLESARALIQNYRNAAAQLTYLDARTEWIDQESGRVHILIPTLLRPFHWEEDAGGSQLTNKYLPWWERTRINRKDLLSSLIFGIRVSLVVGITAVTLALLIGIPLGLLAGYFAGKLDLFICRLVEIWEAMPTFFMLLLIVAIVQTKSLFIVIAVLGIFGWPTFCRYIRAEVLRQRSLPYVLATKSLGYGNLKIMFSHILPNAIPPILTLLPFSLMAAITSEAALSFLGLGEEGSSSWGVLMDEGRSVFPGESYLLWPPAILLTLLLIAIALIGDVLRDALDPKLRG